MFDWLWRLLNYILSPFKTPTILIVGPPGSGKTTLLHMVKTGRFITFESTKSYCKETLSFEQSNVTFIDLGDSYKGFESLEEFSQNVSGIVLVVDASDSDSVNNAKKYLDSIYNLQVYKTKNIPVLIFGNKQDVVGCISREELKERLNIVEKKSKHEKVNPETTRVQVQMMSAKQNFGYQLGLRWLVSKARTV
ncbi:ADP-ribosylation factor family protein [Trichomonas vaginalis G3]|uniref:ADP-ribosylation factor family protein n=1 Tax=Trichomonas vaginalis (strain ATCC PRA-98 / G3) TaxID=412133 RepID=A2EGS8_TRIV3|nr:intracellular protein transport [Trichomonas vaginalis G3]EAY08166.1 ADP-ribosylation factor family protein [Trichomonas vaginalis G3]KAI5548702.1 intracellular protein transport [Trichomonas vaginalis G3]|eukprot:XP_001320389.1 ADP-ribosylation factor family protein [Trichomonas vaginalis G3]